MRLYLLIGVLALFPVMGQAKTIAPDDTTLSCKQIYQEIEALEASGAEPSSGVVNDKTIKAGTNVATQAASIAGVGREASLVRSIFGLFSALTPSKPAGGGLSVEAQKRITRLETVAEMKGC